MLTLIVFVGFAVIIFQLGAQRLLLLSQLKMQMALVKLLEERDDPFRESIADEIAMEIDNAAGKSR